MKIQYLVQTSDHDGYCSGNECEYAETEGEIVVDVPEEVVANRHYTWSPNEARQKLAPFIEELVMPNFEGDGSGYCDVSLESIKHGLGSHDGRVVVLDWKDAKSRPPAGRQPEKVAQAQG